MHKKHIILSTVCTLLPILAGLILWKALPENVPIHFDINGIPDDWSTKYIAIFVFPILMTAVHLLIVFLIVHDPQKRILGNSLMCVFYWIIPIMSCGIAADIFGTAMGVHSGNAILIDIVIGLFLIICGCYIAEQEEDYIVGIIMPWTQHDESNKDKTQILAGRLFVTAGFIYLINIFILKIWVNIIAITAAILIPVIYSFINYKKGK